jgi:hypothetical protein
MALDTASIYARWRDAANICVACLLVVHLLLPYCCQAQGAYQPAQLKCQQQQQQGSEAGMAEQFSDATQSSKATFFSDNTECGAASPTTLTAPLRLAHQSPQQQQQHGSSVQAASTAATVAVAAGVAAAAALTQGLSAGAASGAAGAAGDQELQEKREAEEDVKKATGAFDAQRFETYTQKVR